MFSEGSIDIIVHLYVGGLLFHKAGRRYYVILGLFLSKTALLYYDCYQLGFR